MQKIKEYPRLRPLEKEKILTLNMRKMQ